MDLGSHVGTATPNSRSARGAFLPTDSMTSRKFGLAGVGGLEPTTLGFGDRCSTN